MTLKDIEDEARDLESGAMRAEKEAEKARKSAAYWADRAKTMRRRANEAHIKVKQARAEEDAKKKRTGKRRFR